MITGLILAATVLLVSVLYLVFRLQVLSSILSDDYKKRMTSAGRINAFLLVAFFVVGTILFVWSVVKYWDVMNLPIASEHGVITDNLFYITMGIITVAFLLVNALLFYFSYRFQYRENKTAYFFPHNNKLEMIWTIIPAIVLSILIFGGWKSWRDITSKAPDESVIVEIMGKQFAWQVRYPGSDNKLGKTNYKLITDENIFGMDFRDKFGMDDIIPREIHIPVGQPILFKIRARDVIHSVYAPHFRLKMDAVPGMPTSFWFVPTKTTEQMRVETGNPKFNYEIACTEVCGRGHFAMKKLLVVDTPEEYQKWLQSQESFVSKNPQLLGIEVVEKPIESELNTNDSTIADLDSVSTENNNI